MAISSKPVRRMVVQEVKEAEDHAPRSKPKSKAMRRFAFGLLLLGVLAWFLPLILAKTPLLGWAINRFGNLKGHISIQSASLGWFSTPSLSGVELRDQQNQPVIEHLSVSGTHSFFGMIANPSNLGCFHIDKPKLTLRLRPDGSNLEDVIANYLTGESSSKKIGIELDITDATVEIIEETSKRTWQMDQFSLNLKMPAGDAEPMTVKTSGRLPDSQKPGKLSANIVLSLASKSATNSPNEIKLQTENFPLEVMQPVLGRFVTPIQLSGWLNADIHSTMADLGTQGKTTVQGTAAAENFVFAMPALGKDQIRLTGLRADGKGTFDSKQINLEQSSLVCDLGNAKLSGSLQLKDSIGRTNLTTAGLLRQRYEMSGRVDLARLAAVLPNLLHVRKQTQITSGEVQASFSCRPRTADLKATALAWEGHVHVASLAATDNGRQLAWAKPIAAGFVAYEEPRGIVVESLQCDSDFLKISANGTTDNLTASATFNLKQLANQLGQFVELSQYQLAGDGWANANWKRDPQQQFEADSEIQLQNFQVVLPGQLPWKEPNLATTLSAKGKTDFSLKNTAIDAANVSLKAGQDEFAAQLREPVKDLSDGGVWSLHATAQGQLPSWLSRAAAFAPLAGYQAAGAARLEAQLTASSASVIIADAKIHADGLALRSPSINLDEPQVDFSATGSWITKQRRLTITSATLTNSTISATAKDFVLSLPEQGPVELAGTVQYQGNLTRLRQCIADRTQPSAWGLGGLIAGGAQFKQADGVIHCETAADVTNLVVADASGQQFTEPIVQLKAIGDYDNKTKLVKIDQATISSATVAASALGQVGIKEPTSADINGQISYDLNRISALLRPSFGKKVRFSGQDRDRPLTWRGPLSLDQGQAATEIKWDSAYLYGFNLGPAAIKPKLERGVLAIEPMQVAVSQGKLYLAPKVRLAPGPMELAMPPGKLVEQVQITPDMCEMFLKYVAPVLADVTEARGTFSIELANCRLPLADPKQGDLKGKFIVHDVEIGPGPLIREIAILMERETPAKLRQQSVVNFQMYQGRIYHDNMELLFPDFTIRTKGSVGIDDQTLAVLAEMPIPPKWLVNNPAAPALKDQTLALPIGGTLSKPALDKSKLEEYTRKFIRKAAGNLLEEGLKNGLPQLFRQPGQ